MTEMYTAFDFQLPTRIVFGPDKIDSLGWIVRRGPILFLEILAFQVWIRRPSAWLRRAWSTIHRARQASSRSQVFVTRLVTER